MAKAYPKRVALHWKDLAGNTLPTYILGVLDGAYRGRYGEGMEVLSPFQLGRVKKAVAEHAAGIVLTFQGACNSHQKILSTRRVRAKQAREIRPQ